MTSLLSGSSSRGRGDGLVEVPGQGRGTPPILLVELPADLIQLAVTGEAVPHVKQVVRLQIIPIGRLGGARLVIKGVLGRDEVGVVGLVEGDAGLLPGGVELAVGGVPPDGPVFLLSAGQPAV